MKRFLLPAAACCALAFPASAFAAGDGPDASAAAVTPLQASIARGAWSQRNARDIVPGSHCTVIRKDLVPWPSGWTNLFTGDRDCHPWNGYFATWAWRQAGVPVPASGKFTEIIGFGRPDPQPHVGDISLITVTRSCGCAIVTAVTRRTFTIVEGDVQGRGAAAVRVLPRPDRRRVFRAPA